MVNFYQTTRCQFPVNNKPILYVLNIHVNRLTPNDPYMGRTAPLTSKRCI